MIFDYLISKRPNRNSSRININFYTDCNIKNDYGTLNYFVIEQNKKGRENMSMKKIFLKILNMHYGEFIEPFEHACMRP